MSLEQLYNRPCHLVRRLHQISVAIFMESRPGQHVTPVQYATLATVNEYPDLDIRSIANMIAVDRSTLGSVIDRFDKAGLVERLIDPDDRRSRVVRITREGAALLARLAPEVAMVQDRICDRLTHAERSAFIGYLAEVVHVNNDLSRAPLRRDGQVAMPSLYALPGHLIRRLQQICEGVFAEYVTMFNVTPVQYNSLVAIADYPGIDNTRLAQLVALDRATIGSVVGRLEAKGWIEATTRTADRRAKHLTITPAGRTVIAALGPVLDSAETRLMDALGCADRVRFQELLRRLVDLKNDESRAPQREIGRTT